MRRGLALVFCLQAPSTAAGVQNNERYGNVVRVPAAEGTGSLVDGENAADQTVMCGLLRTQSLVVHCIRSRRLISKNYTLHATVRMESAGNELEQRDETYPDVTQVAA